MFAIEKNIPAPSIDLRRKYPFREMEVGDSFFVPFDHREPNHLRSSIYTSARDQLGGTGQVSIRADKSDGVLGFRIWRIGRPTQ